MDEGVRVFPDHQEIKWVFSDTKSKATPLYGPDGENLAKSVSDVLSGFFGHLAKC